MKKGKNLKEKKEIDLGREGSHRRKRLWKLWYEKNYRKKKRKKKINHAHTI